MKTREETIHALLETLLELPDGKLQAVLRFSVYMRDRFSDLIGDRLFDLVFDDLRKLAEEKGSVLYAILFRDAGVGIHWFEHKRAGKMPSRPEMFGASLAKYNRDMREWNDRGLVVYKYYKTLSEAIAGEWKRLEGLDLPSREEDLADHG